MKSKYIKPTLIILEHEIHTISINEVSYVSARDTAEIFNLDWRGQKRQLSDPDSVILYGVIDISTPEFADLANPGSRKSGVHKDREDIIFIQMDRVMMYIARVSTTNMRANGNHDGADSILAKQLEFAQALHDYETLGMAINRNHFGQEQMTLKKQEAALKAVRLLNETEGKAERQMLQSMIAQIAPQVGLLYQPDLLDKPE